jgi:GNAT superfamily N-acetyltransferase
MQYRTATVEDTDAMGKARANGNWTGGADAATMARYLAGDHHPREALPPRIAFLAEDSGAVIGFIAGHLTRRFGCDGELQWIFVAPGHRGVVVAGELLHRLAAWFAAEGARRVCVNVAPENGRARSFYARFGAQELTAHWMEWSDIGSALARAAPTDAPAV